MSEAKQKAKNGKQDGKIGRGFRQIKPTEYFSPAEEEEKQKKKKKNIPVINGNEKKNVSLTQNDSFLFLQKPLAYHR